jgi:pyrroline-5-carboxylate reductase
MALSAVLPPIYAFTHMKEVNALVGSGPGFFVTLATLIWLGFVMMRFINADKAYTKAANAAG